MARFANPLRQIAHGKGRRTKQLIHGRVGMTQREQFQGQPVLAGDRVLFQITPPLQGVEGPEELAASAVEAAGQFCQRQGDSGKGQRLEHI